MRYDPNKMFPYPVLRPQCDDYTDSDFQVTLTPKIFADEIVATCEFALSSKDLKRYIHDGEAAYVGVVSCRDTFFRQVEKFGASTGQFRMPVNRLRGEVRFDSYVVSLTQINDFSPRDRHPEYEEQKFSIGPGYVLAQNEPQLFHVERAAFAPITSVIDLVANDALMAGQWKLDTDQDHIQIQVERSVKEAIDDARNSSEKRVVLLNGLYFPAIMTALVRLQKDSELYAERKWHRVFTAKLLNEGINLETCDVAETTQILLRHPLAILAKKVLKNQDK